MHREYRPEDLHHPDGGLAVVSAMADRGLTDDRALYRLHGAAGRS